MTSQLGSISPLRLETVLECEVITDLRRGKSKKRKTGGKKIIGSRHLRTTVKEEVVDHGEGDEDVGVKQEVEGEKVNIESFEIKRCELILSRINLAKPGEDLEVFKPRVSQAPKRVGGPLNGLNRQVRANQQRSGAKKTQQPIGVHQAGDGNQVRLEDGGTKSKIDQKPSSKGNQRTLEECAVISFPLKTCEVRVENVGFSQQLVDEEETRRKPTRKSVSSSCLAGPYAFVSVMEVSIDSSIEVLDDSSQDLSWELAEGGTWRETNKQNGKVEKKELLAKQNVHVKGAAQAKLSKRKQAPLASDSLETVYTVGINRCVEDEFEKGIHTSTDEKIDAEEGDDLEHGVRMFHSTMAKDYDCINADPSYVCVFCHEQPHRHGLGDLFGPYWLGEGGRDVWTHVDCAVWVPCVVLGDHGDVEGLPEAIKKARKQTCSSCNSGGASITCNVAGCSQTTHVRCAAVEGWRLVEEEFEAICNHHI